MNIKEEFNELINDNSKTENDLQRFLEENPKFIPTDFLNGHQLHFELIISKLKLGNKFITDFAYLTKNSVKWTLVLIELEQSSKKIFLKDNGSYPRFSSEFNAAMAQVTSWRSYVEKNESIVENCISRLKKPLSENLLDFKYILVIGRDENFSEAQIDMLRSTEREDLKILTYDSLSRRFDNNEPRMILSPIGDKDFRIKHVSENYETNFFSWINSEGFNVGSEAKFELIKQGYSIDKWESGELLNDVSNKMTREEAYEKSNKTDFDRIILGIDSK